MSPIQTVVVAVDFSDNAKEALDAARDLARPNHGRIHLLHVVPDVFHTPWMVEAPGVDFDALQRHWLDEADEQLVVLAASRGLDPLHVSTATVAGTPAVEVVRYANEHDADVIVLGSHGHGLIRRFMLGSVADRVVRQAVCPVLVVPHRLLRVQPDAEAAARAAE